MKKIHTLALIAIILTSSLVSSSILADENQSHPPSISADQYERGYRYNIQGWIYVHIEGGPYERGFQHGYLLSAEIVDMLNRWSNGIHNNPKLKPFSKHFSEERYKKVANTWWDFCISNCYRMYWDKIPEEYQKEIEGIADGVTARGGQIHGRNVTFKDILTLNEMYEFMSKLTRMRVGIHPFRTFIHQLEEIVPETKYIDGDALFNSFFDGEPPHHCNGFIATGNATSDGQLVFTHSTICGGGAWWWTYYLSLRWNVMLDIQPSDGNRIMMPTSPGFIWSDEDYYQNDNGIVFLETTNPQGLFDNKGLPLMVRARNAIQKGDSIDDVIYHLRYKNDGSMNAVWLIGDTKTGEISRFELGYRAYAVWRTFDGYYWSANNPYNLRVRLEKFNFKQFVKRSVYPLLGIPGFGYFAIRYRPESRDLKYDELGKEYYGQIDIDIVKEITSTSPISDWITDIKITDSTLLKQNGVWAFFGNPHKVLNITNLDSNVETIRQVQPCGWVRFFGVPEKENFTLLKNDTKYEGDAEVLWEFDTGDNVNDFSSSGVVDEDTLYITTSSGDLYSIDAKNGEKKWSTYVGEKPTAPVVSNDLLFVGHSEGLSVFDKAGNSKWEVSTPDIVSRPVVAYDNVIFGDNIGNVYCFYASDGMEQWMLNFSDEIYVSQPYFDTIYIASGKSCYAISIDDHEIVWNFTSDGMITSPPTMKEGIVYFSSWDNHIYAVNASNGELQWEYEAGWGFDITPVVSNDLVFAASADNNVYALDADNGNLSWFFSCNAAVHSTPVVFGEYVFFGCDDGRLYALNTSTGKSAWFFAPERTIDNDVYNFITTPFISDPVIDDGIVYVGLNGIIYALDTQTIEAPDQDTSPPETTIVTGPSETITEHNVTFTWMGSDDETEEENLVYRYMLEGIESEWSDWTDETSKTYTDLPDGNYTFFIETKDEAGNTNQTPAELFFTIKTGGNDEENNESSSNDFLLSPKVIIFLVAIIIVILFSLFWVKRNFFKT